MADIILTTEVADLLSKKWAFLSGGRTSSSSRIISLVDNEHSLDEVCSKLIRYLFDVVVDLDERARFVLVVDRRKAKWSNIKPLLSFIQDNFPNTSRIEKIFLLQPNGMFSSLYRLVSLNVDDAKIELLSGTSDLHKKLDKSQLTVEFDGVLEFAVDEWIDDRKMVESSHCYVRDLKRDLEEFVVRSDRLMSSCDGVAAMSREEIQERMEVDAGAFQLLRDKIKGSQSNSKANLAYFHSQNNMPSKLDHAAFVQRLQLLLGDLKSNCESHSERYQTFMASALRTAELNARVDRVIDDIRTHLGNLSAVNVVGCSSLENVQVSLNSVKNVENSVKSLLEESECLSKEVESFAASKEMESFAASKSTSSSPSGSRVDGDSCPASAMGSSIDGSLSTAADPSALDHSSAKLLDRMSEMNGLVSEMKVNLQFAFKQLQKAQEAVSALDKACAQNKKGEELVGRCRVLLENPKSCDKLRSALKDLKTFRDTSEAQVHVGSSFPGILCGILLEEVDRSRSRRAELIGEVDKLVESLADKLNKLEEKKKLGRNVQKMQREGEGCQQVMTYRGAEGCQQVATHRGSATDSETTPTKLPSKHRNLTEPKIVVDSRIIPNMLMNDKSIRHKLSIVPTCSDPSNNNSSSAEQGYGSLDHPRSFHLLDIKHCNSVDDMEKYIPQRLREDLLGIQPVPDSGTIRRKRSHVIQELIETERMYTSDLRNIIEGYYHQFDNPDLRDLIPDLLVDKRDVLFGNIIDIHNFHSEIFLKSLEACEHRTADVGKCFVENKERLQLYSAYCQNKIQAELLIERVGDNNAFFRECQRRLNHSLPFSSYILKPVQRITKYHLLLKELVRMTTNELEASDLKRAIMSICDVLRYVNNSMHQLSISGFSGNLVEQGKLLMQGSLEVNVEKRKDRGAAIKQTFHKRQVFLYDRCILFCKKKDQSSGHGSYVFKCLLKTDEVGPLVESPKGGDEKRFELWSKNEVWSFIAPSSDEKLDWTEEIKKVLYEQMDLLRSTHKRLLIDNPSPGRPVAPNLIVSNEPDSLISSDFDVPIDT